MKKSVHPDLGILPGVPTSKSEEIMAFGSVIEVDVGAEFSSRRELYDAGVHRALQAGIVGRQAAGAESVVLSGGYADDEDYGDVILYTGDGGQDDKGNQVGDQDFFG
jgi:putative restriction endonuclease